MKCTLVATAKNEGPYIWEWVAHHRRIGFSDIIIFQNDSDDFTQRVLRTLDAMGVIQYFPNHAKAGRHQIKAYRRAGKLEAFMTADWAMALDLDEFLAIRADDGHLSNLLSHTADADAIHINWNRYGTGGHHEISDDLVTERFVLSEPPTRVAERFTGYKTLFRPAAYGRPGIHQPREIKIDAPVRFNGSGLREGAFALQNWRCTDPEMRKLAQVNHYAVRDTASFILKSDRGSAHQGNRDLRMKYFLRNNFNDTADTVLHDRAALTWAAMETLDQGANGRLSKLRARSIGHHQTKAKALLGQPEFAALYDACLSA